ncbi:hypothetical protein SEUBUCD646_0H03720 [Saccharomyces eubayanus]|uniref:Uncharacterized protein n=1 Tax=Saccharomyces eubayanus TaxID=1080349 RepID=A0ABN8VRS1_SACEU|nr:hypothetical protein SEUBUCD650_0H03730 [Saccharomyces eubayanus]CAI2045595.1 hypothetical protein SEUBUCD646_0H03720 [Saccharomyces eubayanus]
MPSLARAPRGRMSVHTAAASGGSHAQRTLGSFFGCFGVLGLSSYTASAGRFMTWHGTAPAAFPLRCPAARGPRPRPWTPRQPCATPPKHRQGLLCCVFFALAMTCGPLVPAAFFAFHRPPDTVLSKKVAFPPPPPSLSPCLYTYHYFTGFLSVFTPPSCTDR